MDPICFTVPRQGEQSIKAEYWELPCFYRPYHYHKECQLTYIVKSSGELFVSDTCVDFKQGDLFLIGENLPHVFRSDANAGNNSESLTHARAITIFFDKEQFIKLLDLLPEAYQILSLLSNSNYGIKLSPKQDSSIERSITNILESTGFEQVISLMNTFSLMVEDDSALYLSTRQLPVRDPLDSKKMKVIVDFIQNNYNHQISLEDVAGQISMTSSAFCRFFKKKTQKTFSDYLIETRIARACKLLTQEDYTVSETCYESGYNSTSNFHRHFKRVTGLSPNEYKKRLLFQV
ncbi:MAG: helix-turn-helix transcriptional regulator [Bacteroidetes bacterium]|jgi:AraC-like DNA-binding protein|nr:helix-turn-helix transcriptional regulator [Bacteroidota bacterium]MBT3750439.1 helix-turn-helix transcriptional regulator [Bacteroidota bacterium]MBT4397863.1 helix-turn-helix transcriptional regulator [Bacteroidota bacterium]MBT4411455.1 helix-turn-helix transcriptional regulator [Bacteroidota bacterium]MBT5426233.1 helix-turn-helix transcriptional regulator [Bacteroidota bacterium]